MTNQFTIENYSCLMDYINTGHDFYVKIPGTHDQIIAVTGKNMSEMIERTFQEEKATKIDVQLIYSRKSDGQNNRIVIITNVDYI